MLEWYAVVTCRDVDFEDLTVRCKRTDNRCPILSSLSAPDGNQQGPCMGFPVCSPPCKVPAGYHLVRLMKTESGSEIVHPWIPSVGFELYLLVLSNPGSHVQCVSLGLSLEIEAS